MLEQCPRHEGAFDCTPFCQVCEGEQEYDPQAMTSCQVPECTERLTKEIYIEELGFCAEHSFMYFNQELDPFTLEKVGND